MQFSDKQIDLHEEIITELESTLEDEKFEEIKQKLIGKYEYLSETKNIREVICLWQMKYKIGILDYGILKDVLKEVGEDCLIKVIESKEKEMKRIDGPEDLYYKTEGQKGYLLILNFEENRDNTEHDVTELINFFGSELRFDVKSPRDYRETDFSKEEINTALNEATLNLSSNPQKYYCFVCVVLSHGSKGLITTTNGPYKEDTLIQTFISSKLTAFAGKPKIFFFQKCQGKKEMKAVQKPTDQADDDRGRLEAEKDGNLQQYNVPEQADILLTYATTPGYKSYRRDGSGSWLIQNCVEEFKANYCTKHLEEMLITVRYKVSQMETSNRCVQMPCTWSTLTKRLMLK